ncbi:MAG: hypothetical protein CMI20_09395 [Opitutae bacterium]|nr:hypothetical protein [Opitutae bacterium]|tara:strand:- start:1640 stop:2206 length:567 start_codon:yes stop_codon:yes gene_type:complete
MINKLTIVYNLTTERWQITKDLKPTNDVVFNFGFEKDGFDVIQFNGLKFGLQLWRTTNAIPDLVCTRDYPKKKGIGYNRLEGKILETDESLVLSIADDFRLELYAENDGKRSEFTYEFTVPMPSQPYPSWKWNGRDWEPPIDQPDDTEYIDYIWDETTRSWKSNAADPALATMVSSTEYGAVESLVEE